MSNTLPWVSGISKTDTTNAVCSISFVNEPTIKLKSLHSAIGVKIL